MNVSLFIYFHALTTQPIGTKFCVHVDKKKKTTFSLTKFTLPRIEPRVKASIKYLLS